MRRHIAYRFAVAIALLTTFLILWVNLAVGIIGEPDDPANLMYVAVPALGMAIAAVGRFQPPGMSRAMFAAVLAQALVGVLTAVAGLGAPVTPIHTLLVLNGILITLWGGSALLFRKAVRAAPAAGRGH